MAECDVTHGIDCRLEKGIRVGVAADVVVVPSRTVRHWLEGWGQPWPAIMPSAQSQSAWDGPGCSGKA